MKTLIIRLLIALPFIPILLLLSCLGYIFNLVKLEDYSSSVMKVADGIVNFLLKVVNKRFR